MKKIAMIVVSWFRIAGKPQNEIAKQRIVICQACPNLKRNKLILRIELLFRVADPQGFQCKKCGCGIWAKLSNPLMSCPENKF